MPQTALYRIAAVVLLVGAVVVTAGQSVGSAGTAASFVLGFLSIPGGGGIHMSWWWATTGTFGVIAYMVALAWYAIELLQRVGVRRQTP